MHGDYETYEMVIKPFLNDFTNHLFKLNKFIKHTIPLGIKYIENYIHLILILHVVLYKRPFLLN